MKGSRPEQAVLTRGHGHDQNRTPPATVIEGMVDGLNDHRIGDIGEFFTQNFPLMGNQGCGTKNACASFQGQLAAPVSGRLQRQGLRG